MAHGQKGVNRGIGENMAGYGGEHRRVPASGSGKRKALKISESKSNVTKKIFKGRGILISLTPARELL